MDSESKNNSISYADIQLLNQIGQDFASHLDFDSVMNTIMRRVKKVLHCEASSVILFNEEKDTLLFYASSGTGSRILEGVTIPKGKGIAWWVFDRDEPVVVENARTDERFYPGVDKITHMQTKSLICVPIKKKDKILGVIEGINKREGPFTDGDLNLLTAISQLAGISIENSMIHKNLEEKSTKLAILNKEMEEFVHIVSHDLQTPLASIEGYVGLIKSEMSPLLESDKDLKTYITRIEENCKNTFHFIKRLLSFIKLNESAISVQEFDPSGVLDEILVVMEDEIRSNSARVKNNIKLRKISFDRTIFYHILLNLIQNSLKYSAVDRKPVIEIGAREEEKDITFFIKDNGTGIPKGDMDHIFTLYKRGNNMRPVNGYGIGLAFVKKAVEIFNGKVWVETKENRGSTFYFTIHKEAEMVP